MGIGQVHVGKGNRATVGQVAYRRHRLSDRTSHIGGRHNWRVIAAMDGNGHGRADCRVAGVLEFDVILQSDRLASGEEVEHGFCRAVGPVDGTSVAECHRSDAKPVEERGFLYVAESATGPDSGVIQDSGGHGVGQVRITEGR